MDLVTVDNDPASQEPMLVDISLAIHIFHLHVRPRTDLLVPKASANEDADTDDAEEKEHLRAHMNLVPHVELQGLWES